jgi:two-component system, NarL family, sensor histidine kinase DegS
VPNIKVDVGKLDKIIKKTIEAINNSKAEIFDIAESARRECKNLEKELEILKVQVKEHIELVEVMEADLKDS